MTSKRSTLQRYVHLALTVGLAYSLNGGMALSQGKERTQVVTEAQLQPVLTVQKSHEAQLFAVPGVVAVGTGLTDEGKPAIHVYVTTTALHAAAAAIPRQLDHMPTRLLETDE